MFGTFEPEREQVQYGLVNNVNTYNPVKITFMAWSSIWQDMKQSNGMNQILRAFFGPPSTHVKKL
jgi:hypothetical protein